ncbi:MAG TPA: alpha/beta fold hydrolase [Bryobacteraceae bacterium]|nr:alpha/beta fold hydrolase [Bryobacteraceae bacterium]
MRAFVPFFKNSHLVTIAANYWRRPLDTQRFPVEVKLYDTEPGVRVLVHSQRPAGSPVAEVIVVHGLEGSSQAGYAQSLSHELLQAGWAAHRFNMRSCGGTEHLSGRGLYHSGQTSDLLAVIRQIKTAAPIFLAGFSLGGNVVLKLAGELGEHAPELIAGVIAVSTPIDLAACARKLSSPANFVYSRRFLGRLKQRIRLKAQSEPGLFALDQLDRVKSIYDFDDKFTAPAFGFGTADNYYATQSSNQFLDRIRVPALLVQSKDDPLIPFEVYNHPAFTRNPHLQLLAVEHGGHVGFISKTPPRFWLDQVIREWTSEVRNKAAANFVS